MTYLAKLSKRISAAEAPELKDDEFNPLELLKLDSKFLHVRDMIVQAVKHYDRSYPEIGTDEILAALINEAMEILFPNMQNHKIELP